MSLNDAAAAAVTKKVTLLDQSFSRFAVRSTLAGVYLAIGTAFAAVLGMGVEKHVPRNLVHRVQSIEVLTPRIARDGGG